MSIYIFGWLINYVFMLVPASVLRKKYGAFIALVALSAIAVLRGRVGVDTGGVYEPMAANLDSLTGTEPLFRGLLHILVPLFPTPLMAITVGLGLVLFALLWFYLLRADTREVFYFQAIYIPVLFIGSAISGQRAGLAFAVILIVTQCVRLKQFKSAWLLGAVAVLTHYSSIVILFLWAICLIEYKNKKQVVIGAISAILATGTLIFAQAYLEQKYVAYFDMGFVKPSAFSGLSIVIATCLMVLAIAMSPLPSGKKRQVAGTVLVSLGLFWLIGFYSFSALRFLSIVEGVTPLIALALYAQYRLPFGPRFKGILIFTGVMVLAFNIRNMLDEAPLGTISSPSVPYKFYWETAP